MLPSVSRCVRRAYLRVGCRSVLAFLAWRAARRDGVLPLLAPRRTVARRGTGPGRPRRIVSAAAPGAQDNDAIFSVQLQPARTIVL